MSQSYLVRQASADPVPDDTPATKLLDHYQPLTPIEPYRISVPSKGVFAEAIQGACNACEKVETDRLQDWNRFPSLDEPTLISPIATPTPAVTDWKAAFAEFASPMVNIQNAPATPAPGAGLAGLAELLGKSGVFKDITGLDANQQNVLKTYLSHQENVKALAQMASGMAMQAHNTQNSGRIMDSLKEAKDSGALSSTDYGKLVKDHLQQQIDGGQTKQAERKQLEQSNPSLTKAAVDAVGQGKDVKAQKSDNEGNSESVDITNGAPETVLARVVGIVPPLRQDPEKRNDCWAVCATMMMCWKTGASMTVDDVMVRAGAVYTKRYRDDVGLRAADKDDFVDRLEMVAEPPASYGLPQYVAWIKEFGPLWVTTDAGTDAAVFSPHARILTRITGTSTGDHGSARLTFLDPATGREATTTFAEFIAAFEQMVTENKSENLYRQVVHFGEPVDGTVEGFEIQGPWDIHEPIHENLVLAALVNSSLAVPATEVIGHNQALNEFARGVIWNDDPAILMFHDHAADNWRFTKGITWLRKYSKAGNAASNDLMNLTGRSHYWDLTFLHGMASTVGESPHDTLAKILMWAEVMYRLSISEGVAATNTLATVPVSSAVSSGVATYSYSLAKFFGPASDPLGTDTLNRLLTRDTICRFLDISRRAIGSLLHLVQDSFARGHVKRTLTNPGDLVAGSTTEFKAGKFGHYAEIENFHCYRGQDEKLHSRFDKFDAATFDPADLRTFNGLIGARDAIDYSVKVLNLWAARKPWATGPKQLFEDEIFKLSPTASPANTNVD